MFISKKELEKILVESNYIKEGDFDIAKSLAVSENASLEKILVEKGFIGDDVLGKIMAEAAGYPFINLKKADIEEIDPRLLSYIPEAVALSQKAIVFGEEEGGERVLKVATTDPQNYSFLKALEKKTGKKAQVFYITPFNMDQALKRYKGDIQKEVNRLVKEFIQDPKKGGEENIVELVDLFLDYAYTNLASDIHIEPLTKFTIVRYRIDGILHPVIEFPKELHARVVSRIKILSRLRTDERAAVQDGRFEHKIRGSVIELRVSVMPITEGENVVMRVFMQRGRKLELQELGLLEPDLKKLKTNSEKPYGMIAAVGPTGSGKTTTLYAIVQMINSPEVNIVTIEDPVEYSIERVRQIQLNPAKEITFPKGLRSIVRQDPDVIMVGEMRDKETVDIAINAAMTGHLVLTTMHANDAPTTFARFLEMGADPHLVATSVNVTIAQRLVRNICPDCKSEYFLSKDELATLREETLLVDIIREIAGENDLSKIKFYRGKGCKFCDNTGYTGRTAIFEVFEVTEEIRELISQRAPIDVLRKKAIKQGMTTMLYDGVTKALMGITTLAEIKKATKIY